MLEVLKIGYQSHERRMMKDADKIDELKSLVDGAEEPA